MKVKEQGTTIHYRNEITRKCMANLLKMSSDNRGEESMKLIEEIQFENANGNYSVCSFSRHGELII